MANNEYQLNMDKLKSGDLKETLSFPKPGSNPRISGDAGRNILWIEMKFKKVKTLTGNIWENGGFGDITPGPIMRFVAPMELQETYTHNWEDASNVAGRALQAFTTFNKTLSDATSLVKSIGSKGEELLSNTSPGEGTGNDKTKEALTEADKKKEEASRSIRGQIQSAAAGYRKESFYKYDAPQMYKDSPKPSYHFQFNLADTGNPEYDIQLPVQMLRYLASPSKPNMKGSDEADLIKYEFPYICEINTVYGSETVPIINMEYAAITSLQIGYNGPYRNGIPSKVEITMSLTSLMPVYRATLNGSMTTSKNQGLVSTSSSTKRG